MSLQPVCTVDAVKIAAGKQFELTDSSGKSVSIAVIRDEDGGWHAVSAMCPHADIPIAEGDVEGCQVECWAHSAVFDLNTGEGTLPATSPLTIYPIEIEGEKVLVDVDVQ